MHRNSLADIFAAIRSRTVISLIDSKGNTTGGIINALVVESGSRPVRSWLVTIANGNVVHIYAD